MSETVYDVLVLAAGRGANDPMAAAFDVSHKCLLPVAGQPMLLRVLKPLSQSGKIGRIAISIEDPDIIANTPGLAELSAVRTIETVQSANSASASVAAALASGKVSFPLLVTTADHALLSLEMISVFCEQSSTDDADLTAGLATADTILGAYPGSARTFLKFSDARYSGCNLFAFNTDKAKAAIDFWQRIERDRKKPWRLVGAFGIVALFRYLTGSLSLEQAFQSGSKILGLTAHPVVMPMAEAAIDVDKPEDLELVERILADK